MNHTFAATHLDDPHLIGRSGWLRASVLGANDGIISISSLLIGVAAAMATPETLLMTGSAGLVAGAMSMAAGEYVSVSSQADIERAEVARETRALDEDPEGEVLELAAIYRQRGLTSTTALRVAEELSQRDALAAHMRDEVGLLEVHAAGPLRAALMSGATFTIAGSIPLLAAILAPAGHIIATILAVTFVALVLLGILGARAGGAPPGAAIVRTVAWGGGAMAVTAVVGWLFGVAVA